MPLRSELTAYADDLKLIGTPGPDFQSDIDALAKWAKENIISFNNDKCALLHLGQNNPNLNYFLNGKQLTCKEFERDLGIYVDCKLNYKQHLLHVRKKCYKMINILFKVFGVSDLPLYTRLFDLYVRPIMSYGSEIYGSTSAFSVDQLERVLRYFTKRQWLRLFKTKDFPNYQERLSRFQLTPVEIYRLRLDLLLLFKIARGLVHIPSVNVKFSSRVQNRIILNPVNSNFLRNAFLHRTSRLWNTVIRDGSFRLMSASEFKAFLLTLDLYPHTIGRALKAYSAVRAC